MPSPDRPEDEEEIPPQFLDFAGRHGLVGFYTPWAILLCLGCYPMLVAVMSVGSPEDHELVLGWGGVGLLMWAGSLVAFRRKRRADEARMAAYRQWRESQEPPPSPGWDRIRRFDGRIADVRSDRQATGYLYVRVDEVTRGDGRRELSVDLSTVLADAAEPGRWRLGGRADVDPDAVREELRTGVVRWFGEHLHVVRWLDATEAETVAGTHFG
ncbi:hypothetical protein [Micromonospora sp. SL4-19]|uniref:hypothetical protein n=1 Tax=Micromonospora sp. SL4-19 TaxID=3399129 RepID=UPI003A4DAE73